MDAVSPKSRGLLSTVGGVASALLAAILFTGVAGLLLRSPALRPWLAVLLGISAGIGGMALGTLRAVNPVDIGVLVLAGMAFAAF
jgi:hypothetical protein